MKSVTLARMLICKRIAELEAELADGRRHHDHWEALHTLRDQISGLKEARDLVLSVEEED